MLVHHDKRSYVEARSEAARHARTKMEEKIATGRDRAEQLLTHLDANMPQDLLIPPRHMQFDATETGVSLVPLDRPALELHPNALGQFASKTRMDYGYLRKLLDGFDDPARPGRRRTKVQDDPKWRHELAAYALNAHLDNMLPAGQNNLIRSVGTQARAFLSEKYDLYDGAALLAAFVEESQKLDLPPVPVESTCTDLRASLKMFLPIVFEPIDGEVLCVGGEWFNSDFGCGRYGVRLTLWRLWCTNYAMMEEGLFEVHLGPKLTNDRLVQFSKKTMDLQTSARIEATRDIVKGLLGPAKVNHVLDAIRRADEEKVAWASARSALSKYLLKGDMEEAEQLWNAQDDMRVPRRKSLYKVSQILGLFAGKSEDGDRKLELERAAGTVLSPIMNAA